LTVMVTVLVCAKWVSLERASYCTNKQPLCLFHFHFLTVTLGRSKVEYVISDTAICSYCRIKHNQWNCSEWM